MMADSGTAPSDTPLKLMSAQEYLAAVLAALNVDRASHITGRMFRLLDALTPRNPEIPAQRF